MRSEMALLITLFIPLLITLFPGAPEDALSSI
jgi:hypothetical protein